MHDSLVSIVMPSYNKQAHVVEGIHSVLGQSYSNWELIIIDDASNDGSVALIKELCSKDNRIILEALPENHGANFCRNLGIKKSKGEYLIFFDADDVLAPFCLERRLKNIENKDLDFAVFTMQVFNQKPGDDKRCWTPKSKNALADFLKHDLPWQTMQPIWKKEFVLKTQGFDESFERLQDVDFHTGALFLNPCFEQIASEPDCYYRIAEGRKIYSHYDFISKRVKSTNKFVDKYKIRSEAYFSRKYLNESLYQTYVELVFELRKNRISPSQFQNLEKLLLDQLLLPYNGFKALILMTSRGYNLKSFRIPGLNRILRLFFSVKLF